MGDLLVKLYDLPAIDPEATSGVSIQRPLAADRRRVVNWVAERFRDRWASEVEIAFSGHPLTCFIALGEEGKLLGFSCYDTSFKGFFGPTGVDENARGKGIGTALLIRTLHAMRESGYAYGVIGYSGADEYYRKTVGAIPIHDSEPGAYRGWVADQQD